MKSISFKILLIIFFASTIHKVEAQMIYDTLLLDEMVIKSNYIDHNSSVKTQKIDTLSKRNMDNLNLGELLGASSPVFIKSYGKGSLATASFRGTAASHTKVLWNGFELNSPMLGQVDFSLIPNTFFDDVSLDYGGSSMENTSGAFGGAINLTSGIKEDTKLFISQSIASFNSYTTTGKASFSLGKLKSSTSVYLNSSENSFSYYNNSLIPAEWQKQESASYYNRGFVQGFEYKISDHQSLGFKNWTQWNFREIPQIMVIEDNGNYKETQSSFDSRNILNYKYHKSKTIFNIDGAWFYSDVNYYLKTSSAADNDDTVKYINSTNYASSAFLKVGFSHKFDKGWSIKSDLGFSSDIINSNNYQNLKTREKYNFSIKINKDIGGTYFIDLIIRQQYADNQFTPTTPYLGFLVKPVSNRELFFRISANMNYNLPSLNDLYWFPGGNSELLPEKGLQMDVGVNYTTNYSKTFNAEVDLNYFYSKISNWIQWFPSDYRYWTASNIELIHSSGIECSLNTNGNIDNIYYKLSLQYAYTKTSNYSAKAIEGGYQGRQLIYVPMHSANAFLHLNYKNIVFHWNAQFTGERYTSLDDPKEQHSKNLPAFSISNISLGKKFNIKNNSIILNVKINNLFNISYQTILWRAMPGINYEVNLSFKL